MFGESLIGSEISSAL